MTQPSLPWECVKNMNQHMKELSVSGTVANQVNPPAVVSTSHIGIGFGSGCSTSKPAPCNSLGEQ